MQQPLLFVVVFLGGGIGSICRYGLFLLVQPFQPRFPWATLLANGLACLALGLFLGWHNAGYLSDQKRLLLATGFCGGFSTFSTFTAESWQFVQTGHTLTAFANIGGSLALCFGCLLLGLKLST